MNKAVVIIPTYNEKDNIRNVISRLEEYFVDLLIIDDNSPDGTASIVKEIMRENSHIHILEREGKLGLGSAYVAGFKWALERDYEYILEMDADLSHNPEDVPRLIERCNQNDADMTIGSRYCKGVNVVNWPLKRLLLSYGASKYTRFITGLKVADPTAGFKCFSRKVLENINLDGIKSTGYSFQIEMNFRAWKKGYRISEVPIIFTERTEGKSKMSKAIIFEAIFMVWKLKILSIFGRLK
ncbi:MAG: polyprenol monophosphomannose synthase [Candidatus Marinimicrobia bacterium]|nr:polyprenol monophosphomannose synthase [Candidatus Neomarinimicrobiota bacterium]